MRVAVTRRITHRLELLEQKHLSQSKPKLEGDNERKGPRIEKFEKDTGFPPGDPLKGGITSQGQSSALGMTVH